MKGYFSDCFYPPEEFRCLLHAPFCYWVSLHLIRDCPIVSRFWKSIPIPTNLQHSFNLSLIDWLKANCSSKSWLSQPNIPCAAFFCSAIWHVWLDRNRLCFDNYSTLQGVAHKAMGFATEIFSSKLQTKKSISCSFISVKWSPPQLGWFKVNSDGSSYST
ncbi:hypothetical protein SLA2020_188950 [Shorea laevis]